MVGIHLFHGMFHNIHLYRTPWRMCAIFNLSIIHQQNLENERNVSDILVKETLERHHQSSGKPLQEIKEGPSACFPNRTKSRHRVALRWPPHLPQQAAFQSVWNVSCCPFSWNITKESRSWRSMSGKVKFKNKDRLKRWRDFKAVPN